MTEAIKPGDMVMVIRPRQCCGDAGSIGRVATVVRRPYRCVHCLTCDTHRYDIDAYWVLSDGTACQETRLKKIDPPASADGTEVIRELEAV